jgi:uncharacterized protein (TIGR02246 family)
MRLPARSALRRTFLRAAVAGATLALAGPAWSSGLSDADIRALRDLTRRYVETSLAGDWKGWASLMAEDAVFLPPNGEPVNGRTAIRDFMSAFGRAATFEAPIDEIAGGDGVAVARGRFAFTMRPGSSPQGADSGKWITTYRKQPDGSWLIHANIWNSSRAVPAASPDRAADERAIRDTIARVQEALNARDYAAAAAPFGDDGDLVLPGAARVTGRVAVQAEWRRAWSAAGDRRIAVVVRSIRFTGPDAALAELTAEFSSGTPVRDRATYVLVRREDRWNVAALRVMPAEGP